MGTHVYGNQSSGRRVSQSSWVAQDRRKRRCDINNTHYNIYKRLFCTSFAYCIHARIINSFYTGMYTSIHQLIRH